MTGELRQRKNACFLRCAAFFFVHNDAMTPKELISKIGRKQVLKRLDLRSNSAISNQIRDGRFPASWFVALRDMAREKGLDVPLDLFRWR